VTKRITAFFVTVLTLLAMFGGRALANENTTYTYTVSSSYDYGWVRTQDAYMPAAIYLQGTLKLPEDMFLGPDGFLYIADTGNSRLLIYDMTKNTSKEFGVGILKSPTGVFVTDDGEIYVADYGNCVVYVFDKQGNVLNEIGRPTSKLFSEQTTYLPRNVVVSSSKTIYVVSEGTFEGLIMFNPEGVFQGFFGANPRDISPTERFTELISFQAQKDRALTRKPRPVTNITIHNDLVHTVTMSAFTNRYGRDTAINNSFRRLNMAGTNILRTGEYRMMDEHNFIDLAVSKRGCIIGVTQSGIISEYDPNGELVFSLGGKATSVERIGLFTVPSAIEVDNNDFLYVLDKERGLVQVYYPTEFAKATHRAIEAFEVGDFMESMEIWTDLLKLNGMSKIAHNGYGKSLFSLGRYEEAMDEFKYTYNREEYSKAFWEVRNKWITSNVTWITATIIIAAVALYILGKIDKKTQVFTKFFGRFKRGDKKENRLWSDIKYIGTVFRHPIDSMYDLKVGKHGSVLSATLVFVIAYAVFLGYQLGFAFLFRGINNFKYLTVSYLLSMFFLPVALFIVGNYMISAINEGEGSFKNVFVCTAYSFAPMILLMPIVILISYFCTFNESFIIGFSSTIIIAWTALYFILMVLEVHRFSFVNMVKNILLTLFAIIIAIIFFVIIYLMAKQVFMFVLDIVREVMFRES